MAFVQQDVPGIPTTSVTASDAPSLQDPHSPSPSSRASTSSNSGGWGLMPAWVGTSRKKQKMTDKESSQPKKKLSHPDVLNPEDGLGSPVDSLDALPETDEYPVLDEGISMSDTTGKVDFISSLPLEISLYVLLFADVETLGYASQVSRSWYTICSDPSVWRDHFYRNDGWQIRPEYLTSATALRATSPLSNLALSTPNRHRRANTTTSEGGIAARIGRRLGDLVSEMGYLAILSRPGAGSPSQRLAATRDSEPGQQIASTSTPSRVRASTAAGPNPSSFYAPPSTPRRNSIAKLPRRNTTASINASMNESILENQSFTHDLPGEGDGLADTTFSTSTPSRLGIHNRRASTNTLSPFDPVSQPSMDPSPASSLALDWRALYRDRLELERRWEEGRFVKRTLRGHTDSVYCVALRGNMLVSGSRDTSIKIWNIQKGVVEQTLQTHTASVLAICLDGDIMATGASNGEFFYWDMKDWSVQHEFIGHTGGVLDIQMTDQYIASCSKDTSIRIWKRDTLEPFRSLQGHRGPVNAIQVIGDIIVSASGDSNAKLWNIETGQLVRVFKGHERGLACVQYNGEVIITGSNDKTIRVWDPNTGVCLKVLKGHKDLVRTMVFDPIRKRIFTGSYDKTTRIWDLESGNLKMTFKGSHSSLVFDVAMDVSRIVSCSHDQKITMYDFGEEIGAERFM